MILPLRDLRLYFALGVIKVPSVLLENFLGWWYPKMVSHVKPFSDHHNCAKGCLSPSGEDKHLRPAFSWSSSYPEGPWLWHHVTIYPNITEGSLGLGFRSTLTWEADLWSVSCADPIEAIRADEGVSSQAYLTLLTFPSRLSLSQQEEHLLASGVQHGS